MNSVLPSSADTAKPTIQVVSSANNSSKKTLYIIISVLFSLTGIAAAVYLIGFRQIFSTKAYDCNAYVFNVTEDGIATAANGSSVAQPVQKVSISINGSPTAIFDVPALSAGARANLGQLGVPVTKEFTWDAIGTSACANHGSYSGVVAPSPTTAPQITPSPLPTQSAVAYVLPTSTIPTSVPAYLSPSPTPPLEIAATGAVENTFIIAAASLILIGLGTLLAF